MHGDSFNEYVLDLFDGFPNIVHKRMFGSWGLYAGGVFFALISDSELYFKVGDANKDLYQKFGSRPFTYIRKGKEVSLSYWLVPEEILEDREQLYEWADRAISTQEEGSGKKK